MVTLNVNPSKLSEIQSAVPNPSGAMSDGEATGGEMSDGGRKAKKIKLRLGGQSPSASRAGSPATGGSRAGSPAPPQAGKQFSLLLKPYIRPKILTLLPLGSPTGNSQSLGTGPIQAHEVAAAVPPHGVLIGTLMSIFKARVGEGPNQTSKKDFIRLVKENSTYGPDKLLRPK